MPFIPPPAIIEQYYGYTNENTAFTGILYRPTWTTILDTKSGWSGNAYNVVNSGKFRIRVGVGIYTNTVGGGNCVLSLYISDVVVASAYAVMAQGHAQTLTLEYVADMLATQHVKIRVSNSSGGMQLLGSSLSGTQISTLSVERIAP